ncbi:M28 family peptidase [Heliorestis convoluta]|uniref:Peptidase M28 n=1 Tax=Heliorestis convoluta TaxID=356322 RepID=A0A5Q2N2B9_9FIRM|nr:M28 family peptidase [Heliorestis convoluta]QGG48003.1 Peptidase M28 [Heliorestis convoluta]
MESLCFNLKKHVEKLAAEIGPRNYSYYNGLEQAADYIHEELASMGYEVQIQEFEISRKDAPIGSPLSYRNIIAIKPGIATPDEVVIVGAHYDSCGDSPGADDNASGIAGMLELARLLKNVPLQKTVKFIAFTNEEPPFFKSPYMGSFVYAQKARQRNEKIKLAIIFEMIGYYTDQPPNWSHFGDLDGILSTIAPSDSNFIAAIGNSNEIAYLERMDAAFNQKSTVPMITNRQIIPHGPLMDMDLSDHWSFWEEGYRAVMITDTAFYRNPHYHTLRDTLETLDYEKMAQVVSGFSAVMQEIDKT